MDKGIPDCPDCGSKGMCDKHKVEYRAWVCDTAINEYEAALKEWKTKLDKLKTERNKNAKCK